MKKIRLFLLAGAIVCFIAALAACGSSLPALDTPEGLSVDEINLVLSWNPVDNARSYTVSYVSSDADSGTVDVRTTSYSLTRLGAGNYSIKVRANGDGDFFSNSGWSESYAFEREYESGLTYKLADNGLEYEVAGMGNSAEDVVVEDIYRGKPVTSIADSAFYNVSKITSIVIGSNVARIGVRAFYNCSYLESVTFSNSVTDIGEYAFQSCRSLDNVVLPEEVTEIKQYTFSYCRGLTDIVIGNKVTEIAGYAFSNCSALESIEIPSSVKSLGEAAFESCTELKAVNNASGITAIGESAFLECTSLQSITIGTDVGALGDYAFFKCIALEKITIPANVVSIGDYAFYGCVQLGSVTGGGGLTQIGAYAFAGTTVWKEAPEDGIVVVCDWVVGNKFTEDSEDRDLELENIVGIADCAFIACTVVGQIDCSETLKYIGSYAFAASTKLWAADFAGIQSIGFGAFSNCPLLEYVTLGNQLRDIGMFAFYSCERLAEIEIPETVTRIGGYAFKDAKLWTNTREGDVVTVGTRDNRIYWAVGYIPSASAVEMGLNVPATLQAGIVGIADYAFLKAPVSEVKNLGQSSIKYIGRAAFMQSAIQIAMLPTRGEDDDEDVGLTVIRDYTFYDCESLVAITIPDTVTRIGKSAFYANVKLSSITIPDSVTELGDYAFYLNFSLTSVTLGNHVEKIGRSTFYQCPFLERIVIPASVTEIGENAFYQCVSMQEVTFGGNETSIGDNAFYQCLSLASVVIPDSVTSIGAGAFRECSALQSAVLGSGVGTIGDNAFYGCKALESVVLCGEISSVGANAFAYCSLTSAVLGGNVAEIGEHAFYGNSSLTVYSEWQSQPSAWDTLWNSSYRPVIWGCTLSEDGGYVVSVTRTANSIFNTLTNEITAPVRAGYDFVGWSKTENGTNADYTALEIASAQNGTTLYAVWKESEREPEENYIYA